MGLNHSETVYSVKRFEKVRYSRTTPNSRQRQVQGGFTATLLHFR